MAKVKYSIGAIIFLTVLWGHVAAQTYPINYIVTGPDSVQLSKASLPLSFSSRFEASSYIAGLLPLLQGKGFITASLDSVNIDSTGAIIRLFLGERYKWGSIRTEESDRPLLEAIRFPAIKGAMDFATITIWQKKILDYLEEIGHPFGKTYLDSIEFNNNNEVTALLKLEKGPVHKIDSIQVIGDAKVNNEFLQKFLELPNGSVYNKQKLEAVSKKISELTYVEEQRASDLTMLATGSTLNLYLKAKRSSQVNALIGFLPNTEISGSRKLLLTVDANVLLKNALGSGETIGLIWQQLQKSSPRLNLLYEQPYIFKSAFGVNFSLDMYKRDSIFLNINMNLGATYRLGDKQTASVFLQRRQTIVNGINAASIIRTKQLPQEADVSSVNLGVGYDFNNTDYRFNPRKGTQFFVTGSAGTKKLKKNSLILELKDPSDPSFKFEQLYDTVKLGTYQFRLAASGAHFVQTGKQTTLKLGVNAGIYQSASFFRNELFQIGGNRLLRGFDEESQFVSQYGVGTVEFRLLTGLNSAFFGFVDGGWGKHPLAQVQTHTYVSAGAGLSFQPKAGLINVTFAVGKRNDANFNLRQSKIHIGFVSFF